MIFFLLILVAGSAVFMLLAILAAERYRSVKPSSLPREQMPALSVLKPLHGHDEGLDENLRSFFAQDYPEFEILFAVESEEDRAVPVVKRLIAEHPEIAARLVIAGSSPVPNAKVHSLRCMEAEARYDLIVMADSDVRVTPRFLRVVAAEMSEPNVASGNLSLPCSCGKKFLVASRSDRSQHRVHCRSAGGAHARRNGFRTRDPRLSPEKLISKRSADWPNCSVTWPRTS